MKYPKEYLDEIKLRLKVSQVVGKSVDLKKRGKEFIGLSPFKNEKSPSFTVSDEKEFYHCFSTGEHGNIFDFLMKTKSMRFGEAVKILAAEAGMQPYRFSNFDEKKEKQFNKYKEIYHDYLNQYHNFLLGKENEGSMDYLKKRNLNSTIIKEFKLGYVPWKNNFYDGLLKKYTEDEIALTGLYYKNEKTGKYIDRFNSRIIFPIRNLSGDTIAFGGRIIKESKLAKYINSPETEFYKKGKMIFNLDKAKLKRSETEEVIIVEGYMDVVSLYSAGIKNVISNSGTALTENQIELIWKFFSNPIICLDGDKSGQLASLRIAQRLFPLIKENNKIYFSILPDGKDPDDFIQDNGKEYFLEFLKYKKIIQTYIWDLYSSNINKNDPFAISKFEKEIKKLCFSIKDETLRKYILEEFLVKIKNFTPIQNTSKSFKKYKDFNKKKDFKILNETKVLYKKKDQFTKEELTEYSVLFIMINYPNIVISKFEELSEIIFSSNESENLKNNIIELLSEEKEIDQIKNFPEYEKILNKIEHDQNLKVILNKKNDDEKLELFNDYLHELKNLNHRKKIEFLEAKLSKNLDESSYTELIKLKNQLNRE